VTVAVLVYGPIFLKRWQYKYNYSKVEAQDLNSAQKIPELIINPEKKSLDVIPISAEFGLVIPKIKVNVPVVKDVDANIPKEYFEKLKLGVGHYKGTPFPDSAGNVVIFGHSSAVPGVTISKYAEAFLLLDKLVPGDIINLFYKSNKYTYKVDHIEEIEPTNLDVIKNTNSGQLTLITCWPPGTDIKRLVAIANKSN